MTITNQHFLVSGGCTAVSTGRTLQTHHTARTSRQAALDPGHLYNLPLPSISYLNYVLFFRQAALDAGHLYNLSLPSISYLNYVLFFRQAALDAGHLYNLSLPSISYLNYVLFFRNEATSTNYLFLRITSVHLSFRYDIQVAERLSQDMLTTKNVLPTCLNVLIK